MSNKAEKAEAIERLRALLKPGDTVYTILRHVSRSGMSRSISVVMMGENGPNDVSWAVARAGLGTFDRKNDGVKVSGCGMDMGFHLVYNLSWVLHQSGFGCVGERCPSNDHSNGDRDRTPHGAVKRGPRCNTKPCTCHDDTAWTPGTYLNGCGCGCHRAEHWHKDGGFALVHRWL